MGLFDTMKEPVFLKEKGNSEKQIEELKTLEPLLNEAGKTVIKQDIKFLEWGNYGENNIAFELKNSHMPMYILRDVYLQDGDLNAQIDFMVFTRKICFVIECKNLYGNIEITEQGDFIRNISVGSKWKKEGIYSPITQNERHLELIKKIMADNKSNVFSKFLALRRFEDAFQSVVVLANPKTILFDKKAKKEVKDKVIRVDQLISYIKDCYNKSAISPCSDDKLLKWAQSYLDINITNRNSFTEKYEKYKMNENITTEQKEKTENQVAACSEPIEGALSEEKTDVKVEDTPIFKELKAYRLEMSRKEKIKPYFLFNDNQLRDLIVKMPRTSEELLRVAGFGEIKVKKYGDDILRIIKKYKK